VSKSHPLILLVEDHDHSAVVAGIMQKNMSSWQNEDKSYVVKISVLESVENVLDHETLETYIKDASLKALGLIVDADDKIISRWSRISSFARDNNFKEIPDKLSPEGLVVSNHDGLRFGAWVMPNNLLEGKVETFCQSLMSDKTNPLWCHALNSTDIARVEHGAPWRDAHKDRAEILTWLSWQDPPLGRMGEAIRSNLLNHNAEPAQAFVKWFKTLYLV
jgi:hypothetical protein